jgi:hypothetical protein
MPFGEKPSLCELAASGWRAVGLKGRQGVPLRPAPQTYSHATCVEWLQGGHSHQGIGSTPPDQIKKRSKYTTVFEF